MRQNHLQLQSAHAPAGAFWRNTLFVALAAAACNAVLFLAGYGLNIVARPALFNSAKQPGLFTVVVLSLLAVFAAFGLFRLLETRLRRPIPVLLGALIPIGMFSFVAPMAMGSWTRDQVALFELMHITVVLAILVALWEWRRPVR